MSLKTEYENQQQYRKWSLIVNKLPIKSDYVVAELGCGTGAFAEILSKKVKEVIAIDLNQNLLEILENKKIDNITILQKDEIEAIKSDFLSLLKSTKHINQTKVKFIIAKKS